VFVVERCAFFDQELVNGAECGGPFRGKQPAKFLALGWRYGSGHRRLNPVEFFKGNGRGELALALGGGHVDGGMYAERLACVSHQWLHDGAVILHPVKPARGPDVREVHRRVDSLVVFWQLHVIREDLIADPVQRIETSEAFDHVDGVGGIRAGDQYGFEFTGKLFFGGEGVGFAENALGKAVKARVGRGQFRGDKGLAQSGTKAPCQKL
jgi:hypothetical protein